MITNHRELGRPAESAEHEMSFEPWTSDWYEHQKRSLGESACRRLGFYAVPDEFVLSVVVPVYNEAATLRELVQRVARAPFAKQIILVDDGSTDESPRLMAELQADMAHDAQNRLQIASHPINRGKGAAFKTGFELADGEIVLVQDADLEYDPNEYPRLIQPILENRADVVYGSRFLGDQPHRVLYFWHYVANRWLTTLSNAFTNLNLTDMETCYKVFRRSSLDPIVPELRQRRFGFEPEVTARVARHRLRVYEMSISYSGRTYEEGKKIGWKDGVQALWCILRYGIGR